MSQESTTTPQPPASFQTDEPIEALVDLSPGNVLRLQPSEVSIVDAALTKAEGNRANAAKLLGVPYIQISQAISRHPVLRAAWLQKDDGYTEPVESSSPRLTNRNTPAVVKTDDEIRADGLKKIENKLVPTNVDRSLSKSLHKLGFKFQEIEKLTTVETFAGEHFTQTLSLMHGGMVKGAMRLMLMLERVEQEYLLNDSLPESDRNFWWNTYFRILESLRAMNDQSNKAAITRALIQAKKSESKLGKPGFTPTTAIQINAHNVKVTDGSGSNGS